MITDKNRFHQAIRGFDQANSQDPNKEIQNGQEVPKDLLYAQRMTEWLSKVSPEASEVLQLAARSQHICRWTIPRDTYPMDRKGYLLWRTELKKFHAEKSEEILSSFGYGVEIIDRVKSLVLKQRLKTDSDSQTLEDVVCLVFLQYYFEDFSIKHESEKVRAIIRKTWNKMSEMAREYALALALSDQARNLIKVALEK
jgi:hypothetical protein